MYFRHMMLGLTAGLELCSRGRASTWGSRLLSTYGEFIPSPSFASVLLHGKMSFSSAAEGYYTNRVRDLAALEVDISTRARVDQPGILNGKAPY
jgi:hypothetical protein